MTENKLSGEAVKEQVDYVARLELDGEPGLGQHIGEVDYASDGAMLARVGVAGTNVILNGKYREHVARISRDDFSSLVFGSLPAYEGDLDGIVPAYVDAGTKEWREFMSTRKVVRKPLDDGRGEYSVVPDFDLERKAKYVPKINGEKTYSLAQVFADSHVADKFGLSARLLNSVKTMAISQPDAAAKMLEGAMRQLAQDDRVKVVAGPYSRGRQQCKYAVRQIAGKFQNVSFTIQSMISGRTIILFGPEGEDGWHVSGPVHHIDEIYDVYRMVSHVGTSEPMFLLGVELTVLNIDIHNGEYFECPSVIGHAGSEGLRLPETSSYETAGLLSASQKGKIRAMEEVLLPVTDARNAVVATSVRVTARHVLMSDHVLSAYPDALVDGRVALPLRTVSRDLWAARLDGSASAWLLRPPTVGEMAIICYNAGSGVQYSSPMRVEVADGYSILVTKTHDVVPGLSGGALIALSDFALLGVHSGETLRHNICSQFGQQHYTDLCEADAESQACHDEADASAGDNVYERFKRKGLSSVVDSVIGSVIPLYAGQAHVGLSVRVADRVVTTFDVERVAVKIGEERISAVFEQSGVSGQYTAKCEVAETTTPVVYRNPEHYEKVVVVGRDSLGPYFSEEVTVVSIGVSHRNFVLSEVNAAELPFAGGIVMALSDAAVLGQYVRSNVTVGVGLGAYCLPLRPDKRVMAPHNLVASLQAMFPMLHVSLWPPELVEEVFTHSSRQRYDSNELFNAGNAPLANIGDNAAKAALYAAFRVSHVPHSRWQMEMQRLQSNASLAELAWRFGYAKLLRTGLGTVLQASSKAYADLTEALIGAVSLQETQDTFNSFCEMLGVVPKENSVGTPTSSFQLVNQ